VEELDEELLASTTPPVLSRSCCNFSHSWLVTAGGCSKQLLLHYCRRHFEDLVRSAMEGT
jgi:hypothetical protein